MIFKHCESGITLPTHEQVGFPSSGRHGSQSELQVLREWGLRW